MRERRQGKQTGDARERRFRARLVQRLVLHLWSQNRVCLSIGSGHEDKGDPDKMTDRSRVLIVDDDSGIREVMAEILDLEGYDADTASSGEEAVILCQTRRYSAVVLDVNMPGMNGVETLKALKELDDRMRVIMITGYDISDLATEVMELGAEALFRKPLDIATFLPALLEAPVHDLQEDETAACKHRPRL